MNMQTNEQNYREQQGMATTLYGCEPVGFGDLVNAEEMNALRRYYFVDREIDVDDIYDYQRQLQEKQPELVATAQQALFKVAKAYQLDLAQIKKMVQ